MDTLSQPLSRFTRVPMRLPCVPMGTTLTLPENGRAIREARKRKGLSQESLGQALRVPQTKQQIYKWEVGRLLVKPANAADIAAVLGGSPSNYVSEQYAIGDAEMTSIASMASIDVGLLAEALEPVLASFGLETEDALDAAQNLKDVFAALRDGVEGELSRTVVRSVAVGVMHQSGRR